MQPMIVPILAFVDLTVALWGVGSAVVVAVFAAGYVLGTVRRDPRWHNAALVSALTLVVAMACVHVGVQAYTTNQWATEAMTTAAQDWDLEWVDDERIVERRYTRMSVTAPARVGEVTTSCTASSVDDAPLTVTCDAAAPARR